MPPRRAHAAHPATLWLRHALRQRPVQLLAALLALLVLWLLLIAGPSSSELYTPPHTGAAPAHGDPTANTIKTSIVVPTYHERDNVRPLVTRVFAALTPEHRASTEMLLVDDDSRDGTVEAVQALREEGFAVRCVVRVGAKGLSAAVLKGFEEARGDALLVMDADLQHPPEAVQRVIDALEDPTTPFALGTRYGPDTHMNENWPLYRRVISWGARVLSRPLTTASDPMTGFFGVKKEYFLRTAPINPTGFKIALELLLKVPLPPDGIAEVPYDFGTRTVGESKLSSKVIFRYVGQLISLYRWSWGIFFPLLVGLLGFVVLIGGTWALDTIIRQRRGGRGAFGRKMKLKSEV